MRFALLIAVSICLAACGGDDNADTGMDSGRDSGTDARDASESADAETDVETDVSLDAMRDSDAEDSDAEDSGDADVAADADALDADAGADADAGPIEGPTFTDVTAEAGLDESQWPLGCPAVCPDDDSRYCEPFGMHGGVVAADYDQDGDVDLFVTRFEATDRLFRNNGDGTFTDVAVAAGITVSANTNGAAFVDVDDDGRLDLLVGTVWGDRTYLYMNRGDGTFREEGVARGIASLDGENHYVFSFTAGDYDRDGYVDLHMTEWRPTPLEPDAPRSHTRLYRNLGATAPGRFEDVTVAAGVDVDSVRESGSWAFTSALADMDGDGWLDLAVAGDFRSSRLFWNKRDGTFSDGTRAAGVGTDENGMGATIADFDGDGRLDWFITSIWDLDRPLGRNWGTSGNRLFRNLGSRRFVDVTDLAGVRRGDWGWGASDFDYDGDGDRDLVMTNGMDFCWGARPFPDDRVRLYDNHGDGTFAERAVPAGVLDRDSGKGLVTFDYDGDGDQDIYIANNGAEPHLYRNDAPPVHHLRVRARGTTSDHFSLGAHVEVEVDGRHMIDIVSLHGFVGHGPLETHFGLGSATMADRVTVTWPTTGRSVTMTDVPADRLLTVMEPAP